MKRGVRENINIAPLVAHTREEKGKIKGKNKNINIAPEVDVVRTVKD